MGGAGHQSQGKKAWRYISPAHQPDWQRDVLAAYRVQGRFYIIQLDKRLLNRISTTAGKMFDFSMLYVALCHQIFIKKTTLAHDIFKVFCSLCFGYQPVGRTLLKKAYKKKRDEKNAKVLVPLISLCSTCQREKV